MRLAYAEYAQSQGRLVWRTPQVLPWSAWLRQQRLASRASGSAQIERLLSPAQARVLWDDIVSNSRAGRDLLIPANAARSAAKSWQRLHDYLIPLERLQEFDTPESQALFAWCCEFARRTASMRAIDDARLAQRMYESEFVPAEQVTLAGFDVLAPAVERLAERWRTHGKVADIDEPTTQGEVIRIVRAQDSAAELELAAHWARAELESGARSVGVIVGDLQSKRDEVRRAFEDVFAPGQRHTQADGSAIPVVVAAPAPLSRYPLVDTALLVLRLASGEGDSTLVGRLLRSPFLLGSQRERHRRAIADQRLRKEQRDRWDWFALERWAAAMQCEQLSLAARDLTGLLRGAANSATPSEWAERYQSMLMRIGWPGDRVLTSTEHQTLAKFQDALAEFGSLESVAPRLSANAALHRFHELLRDTPFEPETTNGAVIVIDSMTSAGMSFDALWVVGVQADRVPAPLKPDPLIPLELQRAAQIPEATASGLLRLAQLQVSRWSRSAQRVVFSWPERDGDAELSMSPLLSSYSQALAPTKSTATLRETVFAHRPELERVVDDRAPALANATASGGATILELQSRCPFKAQAELRLKAEPLERVGIGVDPADRGAILHEVLQDMWGALGSQHALLQLGEHELELRVRESAQRHTMSTLQPDTRVRERLAVLEVEGIVRRIMQLLAIEKQRPPFQVRFAEAAERYTIGGLNVTLRPDRIDELHEGGELLIDYKLGDANHPRDWLDVWPSRPRRPQLPLYGLAHGERLRGLAFAVLAAGKVEYRGWSDGAQVGPGVEPYPPKRLRVDLGDPMDWPTLLNRWHFTLTGLAQAFVAGEASVDPLPRECEQCHLSTLCRIHEVDVAERTEVDDD